MRLFFVIFLLLVPFVSSGQGTLMTVAGTGVVGKYSGDGGDARLADIAIYPGGSIVVTDEKGNVFFTDSYNRRIRRVDRKTGIITTFAGNGGTGYSGDGGPATLAEINRPMAIAFDRKGNLLMLDTVFCRLRSISPAGIITTIGGTTCGYDGDGASVKTAKLGMGWLAVGDSDKIYLADRYNGYYPYDKIRMIDAAGIIRKIAGVPGFYSGDYGPALAASFSEINDIKVDIRNDYITVANGQLGGMRVRQIDDKGIIRPIVGNGVAIPGPDGLKATATDLGNPVGITFDQFGNLYVAASSRIRKVNFRDSIVTTIAGTGTPAYSGEGVDAKTSSLLGGHIHFDTSTYELYFFDIGRLRKITNLVKPLSIEENTMQYSMEIYPNPATTKISVSGIPIRSEIRIYDLLGREQLHMSMQRMEESLDVSLLVPGMYIIRARTPKGDVLNVRWVKE